MEQHAYAEAQGESAEAAQRTRPEIAVRRVQVKKQKNMCRFETTDNRVSAEYRKRVVLPRDSAWEAKHAAVRITTVPHGYEGSVWEGP